MVCLMMRVTDAEGNITLFINMRHHKGYLIPFPDCPAVIAGVGNGIDTDGEPDKDGALWMSSTVPAYFP